MAKKIQQHRGLEKDLPVLEVGQIAFTTDTKKMFIGSEEGNVEFVNKGEVEKEIRDLSDSQVVLESEVTSQLAQVVTLIDNSMSGAEIQNLLNRGGYFKFINGTYTLPFLTNFSIPTCLDFQSNTVIELEPNVVITIPSNNLERYYIFNVENKDNVVIKGGTILGERLVHTGSTGEWGYGIRVVSSRNVLIENVCIRNCWGDGIVIGAMTATSQADKIQSENITVQNCTLTNNRRQGISITSLIKGLIQNNIFDTTNGTAPSAGLDIEPDRYGIAKDISILANTFKDNEGNGILLSRRDDLEGDSFIYDITILSNVFDGNFNSGIYVKSCNNITITNNIAKNNSAQGIWLGNSFNCIVTANAVEKNGEYGIYLSSSSKNLVSDNIIKDNKLSGITIQNSKENTINSNIVQNNKSNGISCLTASHDNIISANDCFGNAENSGTANIKIYSNSDRNIVTENKCRMNVDLLKPDNGIEISDATTGSNFVMNNNAYQGGNLNGIVVLSATSTNFGAGNIVKNGTWSVTPS